MYLNFRVIHPQSNKTRQFKNACLLFNPQYKDWWKPIQAVVLELQLVSTGLYPSNIYKN